MASKDVEDAVKEVESYFRRWQDLLEADGASDEFEWTTKELRDKLKNIELDLSDLQETIVVVEESPAMFKLTQEEVTNRKLFVKTTQKTIKDISDQMTSLKTRGRSGAAKRGELLGSRGGKYAKLESEQQRQNQRFIGDAEQQQEHIINQQDTKLDEVGAAVVTLKQMGQVIGDELDAQDQLLDEFGNELTGANDRLKGALKKIDAVLEISKDPKQTCCICILLIAVILMIILYFA